MGCQAEQIVFYPQRRKEDIFKDEVGYCNAYVFLYYTFSSQVLTYIIWAADIVAYIIHLQTDDKNERCICYSITSFDMKALIHVLLSIVI